jgi:20S proteasome alpha/beta subunit
MRFLFLFFVLIERSYSSAAGKDTLIGIVGDDFILLGADSSVSHGSISLTATHLDKIALIVDPHTSSPTQQQTIAVAAAGDAADADHLVGVLTANAAMREFQASVGCDVEVIHCSGETRHTIVPPGLSVEAAARLARGQIAGQIRSSTPLRVCLLVAGMMNVSSGQRQRQSYASKQVQRQVQQASSALTSTTIEAETADDLDEEDETTHQQPSTLQPRLFWLDEYASLQELNYGAHGHASSFCLSVLDQGYRKGMTRKEAQALINECFAQLRMRYVVNSPQPPCIKCIDAQGCHIIR